MKRLLICLLSICLIGNILTGCGKAINTKQTGISKQEGLAKESIKNILFLGNSFTSHNELPEMFTLLASAGGYNVSVESITKDGAKLQDYNNELGPQLSEKLKKKWDIIVLQEQSRIPSIPKDCKESMYPNVRELNKKIIKNGAKAMMYMTWGYRYGDIDNGYATYEEMQEALKKGYMDIAQELSLPVAPVGLSFLKAKQKNKDINLWDDDYIHPTMEGSYLAVCTFYAQIFQKSPVGLNYTSYLSDDVAKFLQQTAEETVLNNKK